MRTAILYRRVSTQRQAEDGQSLAAQHDTLRQYCQLRGWTIGESFEDAGKSGRTRKNRPGLQGALRAMCASKGVLVVYSLSRLARSVPDAAAILGEIQSCGAGLAIVDMAIDTTTAAGELLFNVFSAIAQFESQQTGERVRLVGQYLDRKRGFRSMGAKRFGWKFDAETKQLVHDPATWPLVGRVLAVVEENGRSIAQVCDVLNQAGETTPKGLTWTPRRLKKFVATHANGKTRRLVTSTQKN